MNEGNKKKKQRPSRRIIIQIETLMCSLPSCNASYKNNTKHVRLYHHRRSASAILENKERHHVYVDMELA